MAGTPLRESAPRCGGRRPYAYLNNYGYLLLLLACPSAVASRRRRRRRLPRTLHCILRWLTPTASQTICRFGLETIDEVAFAFSDRHQAEAQSLGQIWSYAQTGAAAEAVRLAKKTLLELRGRATICSPASSSPALQPTIPPFSHTLKRRSPYSSTAAPTPMRDETTRVLVLAEWCHPGKLFPHMAMVSRRAAPQSACMTF